MKNEAAAEPLTAIHTQVIAARELHEARVAELAGQRATRRDRDRRVAGAVQNQHRHVDHGEHGAHVARRTGAVMRHGRRRSGRHPQVARPERAEAPALARGKAMR